MRISDWISWTIFFLLISGCVTNDRQDNTPSAGPSQSFPGQVSPAPTFSGTRTHPPAASTQTPVGPYLETATAHNLPNPTELAPPSYETPDWFRNAVLYEIFVRSYRDTTGDGIGDLAGVVQQLDYLQELGVNAVWLMPVYPSPSEHGYDLTDYYSINPDYGELEDLQELVEAAHARQMKVVLDFVPSHVSSQHPYFQDAIGNPTSAYSDWFVWTNEAHTAYATFGGNEDMPRLNHYNPEVTEYLSQAALFWTDLDGDQDYTDGIDGFRIDNATFPPSEFFAEFRQNIKAVNPDVLLLGEAWVNSVSDLSRFFPGMFDALFDFPLYEKLLGSENINADGILAGKGFPVLLTSHLKEEEQFFPKESIPVRFLSNHDTNRLTSELLGNPNRLKLAPELLAALPGAVMIYYGEEIGMPGEKGGPPAWDNYRREPMDWYSSEDGIGQTNWFKPDDRWNQPQDGISVEEQEADKSSLLNRYQHLMQLRHTFRPLLEGDFTILEIQSSGGSPWGFTRMAKDEWVAAIYNFASEPAEVTIDNFPFSAPELRDLLTGQTFPGAEKGKPFTLIIPGSSAVWLSP